MKNRGTGLGSAVESQGVERAAVGAAEEYDGRADFIAHPPRLLQLLLVGPRKRRRVVEALRYALSNAGGNGTALGSLVADGDDPRVQLAALGHIPHGLRWLARQIDPDFSHDLDDERVDCCRLEPRA